MAEDTNEKLISICYTIARPSPIMWNSLADWTTEAHLHVRNKSPAVSVYWECQLKLEPCGTLETGAAVSVTAVNLDE